MASNIYPTQQMTAIVQQMCDLQQHGGPDSSGLYASSSAPVVLGHRRLALLDISAAGHQPMTYEERYHISFNGEIYNFAAVKKELFDLGHIFHTHTDTEVILAAYSQWGTQSFVKFKGMFAFALWDEQEKELILVRDAIGIKPLYYKHNHTGICFASEIRAFAVQPEAQQNNNWPVYLMAFGHLPEPVTTYSNVQPLNKGCFIKYSTATNSISQQSFKHYSYSDKIEETTMAIKALQHTLTEAVKRHLVADAPIGVFLSGGIDSSILASLAGTEKQQLLECLSIYFDDEKFSEKSYQDIMLQQLPGTSKQFLLTEYDFQELLPTVLSQMDMPSCDGINTWFISRCAKEQGLKAVLSGIGADELFGGYPSFGRMPIALQLQKLPAILWKAGKTNNKALLARSTYLSLGGVKGMYLFLRGHFTPLQIARQLGATEKEVWNILEDCPVMPDISNLSAKNQASWMEYNMYMQNQLLRDADVMGMAHGIEIRVPFLDDEVISLALSIADAAKYDVNGHKPLLIDSFKHLLPTAVWQRKKMGFSFPFAQWLKNSAYLKAAMNDAAAPAQESYKLFLQGKVHWSQMLTLLQVHNRYA